MNFVLKSTIFIQFLFLVRVVPSPFPFAFAHISSYDRVTDRIRLNFEAVKKLDELISDGYDAWVDSAPPRWRADKFLQHSSPILVTSRYGQDARIAIPGCEAEEAAAWQSDRDYSKIAFLTVAIATSIEYVPITFSISCASLCRFRLNLCAICPATSDAKRFKGGILFHWKP